MKANQREMTEHRYLLIVGTPKSATTSLFRYLAAHPDVCCANRKETYFFAREFDTRNLCQLNENLESFQSYFTHCNSLDRLRVEATPYTLYSKNAASNIASMLPNSKILVLLRDPTERLFSNFRFQKQRGLPYLQNKSFEEFVTLLINRHDDQLDALKIGCYIDYLRPFYETFGEERMVVLFYEEFRANLMQEMQKLCRQLGIGQEYYANYQFNIHNQTFNVRYEWMNQLYINLEPQVANLRKIALQNTTAYRIFEKFLDVSKSTIHQINNQKATAKELFPPSIRATLMNFYEPFNQALAEKLNQPLPWESLKNQRVFAECHSKMHSD